MGLLNLASGASVWRGYDYFKENRVLNFTNCSNNQYSGLVSGRNKKPYEVFIDTVNPRKSHCNCPHAKGRRIICKHQVALYFYAFPEEAEEYYRKVLEYEEEERKYQEELAEHVSSYIDSLSKQELRDALYEILYDSPSWVYDRFVRDHIDF